MGEEQRKKCGLEGEVGIMRLLISVFRPEQPTFLGACAAFGKASVCLDRRVVVNLALLNWEPDVVPHGQQPHLRGSTLVEDVRGEKARHDRRPSRPLRAHPCWAARTKVQQAPAANPNPFLTNLHDGQQNQGYGFTMDIQGKRSRPRQRKGEGRRCAWLLLFWLRSSRIWQ
jgi:hypothetical protein